MLGHGHILLTPTKECILHQMGRLTLEAGLLILENQQEHCCLAGFSLTGGYLGVLGFESELM